MTRKPIGSRATEPDRGNAADLRRLKVVGVALPVIFVLGLELALFRLVETSTTSYGAYLALAVVTVVVVVIFAFVMFHFIDRAQTESAELVADLLRRKGEGHGLYDVLLRISNQDALMDILAAVAMHARDLLAGDDAVVWLNGAATRSVELDPTLSGGISPRDGACISADTEAMHDVHERNVICPIRSSPEFKESLDAPIQSRDRVLGELWIGRKTTIPFTERDRQFLETLAGLTSIAITNARMRESEQQGAILAERERIARELHDSLAQVLGVTHLRLRALGSCDDLRHMQATAAELSELADFCQEAYRDVRGAILDLRESSRADHGLADSLRAYLDKYTNQCGIATSLEITPDGDLALAPRSEIQVIRVIQEALTNVRKHSGATAADVRITRKNGTATFVVEDNGRGFDPTPADAAQDRFGLHAMRERMELISGTLVIESTRGRGTRVIAAVPNPPARIQFPVHADGAIH